MRLILPNVDGRAHAIGFRPPVAAGLTGWWWLGDTRAKTEKDHAYLGAATLAGAPTINAASVTFGGQPTGQWLQTEIAESNSFTLMCVAKSTDTFADSAHVPTLMSWWSADVAFASQTNGSLLYISGTPSVAPEARIRGGVTFNSAGTLTTDIDTVIIKPDASDWAFLAMTFNDTSNLISVYDKTAGLTGTDTNTGTRALHSINRLRIGAGHNSSFAGTCDIAWAAAYSAALTSDEVSETYDFVQNVLGDLASITI